MDQDSTESGYPMNAMGQLRFGDPCNTCNNFDLYSFNKDPYGLRGYKFCNVELAASRGCTFCSLLVGAFKAKLRASPRRLTPNWEQSWWIHLSLGVNSGPPPQDIESCGSGLGIHTMKAALAPEDVNEFHGPKLPHGTYPLLEFHVAADPNSQAARSGDIRGRYIGGNVQSEDSVNMIRNWLKICLAHPKCCRTMSGKRVIDAQKAPLPTSSKLAKYLTISHRWTLATAHYSTTVANINRRKRKDSTWWRRLPKVFLDVLELARRLDVRYVWIDSLCIIQRGDEGADWQREATKMAGYYQYSLFTVAATSATEELGLFPPRISNTPRIARLPYSDKDGCRHGHFYIYSYNWEVDKQYISFIQDSELLSRGWVFQEWLLSRRIVYFTPAGIFWECAEQRPHNDRGEVSQTRSSDDKLADNQPAVKQSFSLDDTGIDPVWYRIIAAYSALSLTKPETDRVVALSGISKEFKTALMRKGLRRSNIASTVRSGLEFVSGLWLPDLHHGLLWECQFSGSKVQRIPGFPSWSWTSVLCAVEWDERQKPRSWASKLHAVLLDGERKSRVKPEAELIALATSEGGTFSMELLRNSTEDLIYSPPKLFDIDNCFVSLHMRAKIMQVLVRGRLRNALDAEIISATSGHHKKSNKSAWRAVSSTLRPTEISGWASIEDIDYQVDSLFEGGREMCVLHISTAPRVPGGYGLGYLTLWHRVFNVLFVRETHGRRYERLGVGRIFGKEFEKQLHGTTLCDVELF
ncbi:hypothetical protein H634G_05443 [Metarhizium anisopliae BRIP 53293]|uniref:Heterokaryon incompatibility domain-containing protein n=1 Tax=Metarhizium anisopliae BRIP 53293 TaxID=1291518 RepID=A0A0D9NZG4_METAN|nr:hypothetical protein H634G_05443 [Metarhizium anisopliae BRIP 53293]